MPSKYWEGLRWFLPLQAVSLLSKVSTVAFSLARLLELTALALDTASSVPELLCFLLILKTGGGSGGVVWVVLVEEPVAAVVGQREWVGRGGWEWCGWWRQAGGDGDGDDDDDDDDDGDGDTRLMAAILSVLTGASHTSEKSTPE
jgi:hypothetical protein